MVKKKYIYVVIDYGNSVECSLVVMGNRVLGCNFLRFFKLWKDGVISFE